MPELQAQAAARRYCESFFTQEEIKSFAQRSGGRTLLTTLSIWAVIVGVLAAGSWILDHASPLAFAAFWPIAAFLVASRMHALSVQVHEGSHWLLFEDKERNDWFCNWFHAYWILYDVALYRSVHFLHHRFLNSPQDPDYPGYAIQDRKRGYLIGVAVEGLLMVTAVRRILLVLRGAGRERPAAVGGPILRKALVQMALLGALALANGPIPGVVLYVTLWFIPLFSLLPLFVSFRLLAEHWYPDACEGDGKFVALTNAGGPVETWLFGAQMEYHLEHHLLANIPYYQLRRLHRELRGRGFYAEQGGYVHLASGYLSSWARLFRYRRSHA